MLKKFVQAVREFRIVHDIVRMASAFKATLYRLKFLPVATIM